jgi:hypothetical protein
MIAERKLQKEKEAVEAAERAKSEEEERWKNVPEWKKNVIVKQAKRQEVGGVMKPNTSHVWPGN